MSKEKRNPSVQYSAVGGGEDPSHSKFLELTFNDKGVDVELSLHYKLDTNPYDWHKNIFAKILDRVIFAYCAIIKGQVKVAGEFVLHREEQLDDYINALGDGKRKLTKMKKALARQEEG